MKNKWFMVGMLALVFAVALSGCNKKEVGETITETGTSMAEVSGTGTVGSAPTVAPTSDFEYELASDGEGVLIREYIGSGGDIIVPDIIEGFPVTEILFRAFAGHDAITSVVLPDSLAEYINNTEDNNCEDMFTNCSKLQAVTFPKGLTIIPSHWFESCDALTSITIPDTVTIIGLYAFGSSGLTSIVIPEGVTTIYSGAFSGTNLTSITLPESIVSIRDKAFADCANLETVNLPSHQFGMSNMCFSECPKLSLAMQKALIDANTLTDTYLF